MTACVNRKHTKKVAAVVTASLVGALSLGVAPVAAVADTGIETLALSAEDAFEQGKLTGAKDESGRRVNIPSDGVLTIKENTGIVPTEVTPAGGADPVDIVTTGADANATVTFYEGYNNTTDLVADSDGDGKFADELKPGNYTMAIEIINGDYYSTSGTVLTVNFTVAKAANLADAVLFDNTSDADDVSDTTYTYNKGALTLGVAIDGEILGSGDYTIDTVKKQGDATTEYKGAFDGTGTAVATAGTYSVKIKGAGSYLNQEKTFTISVGKLDLSKATVSIADQMESSFSGSIANVDVNDFQLSTSSDVNANLTYSDGVGAASATITAKDTANITGSATVQFSIVDSVLGDGWFNYGGTDFASFAEVDGKSRTKEFVISDGDIFRANRISVSDGTTTLPESYYTVSYADANGNAVEASALQNPGVYTVSVRINAAACNYAYGSAVQTLKVYVKSGTIESSDIVFKYDGLVSNDFKKTYDGKDFLDQLDVTVTTEDGELAEGTDYTLKAYDAAGKELDSIVDAASGKYKIVVDMPAYNVEIPEADRTCYVTVGQLTLDYVYVGGNALTQYTYDKNADVTGASANMDTIWYLGYTGEELDPELSFGYYTDSKGQQQPVTGGLTTNINDLTWNELPADSVTVTGYDFVSEAGVTDDVDSIKDEGTYKVKFVLENDNFVLAGPSDTTNVITVTGRRVAFADVDPNAWYASSVFEAKQLGYIKGISGSNIYAPNASITRADALVIISRMSGADQTWTAEDYLDENAGFLTRYTDVDSGAYYAKAVAWGTKVGIVHGYGDGTFRPDEQITREEFAAMLANYAEAMGKDISVDADAVLAEFPDGSQVSDWAEDVVAWAADSEIMGNGGVINPQSQITRAEVAAMAVNYQPEKVTDDIIG